MRLVCVPRRLHENRRAVDPAAGALALLALWYVVRWWSLERARQVAGGVRPSFTDTLTGFATNFFGALNVGHALPTVTQALIFIAHVSVDLVTLTGMIAASVAGAWLGAGVAASLPRSGLRSAAFRPCCSRRSR